MSRQHLNLNYKIINLPLSDLTAFNSSYYPFTHVKLLYILSGTQFLVHLNQCSLTGHVSSRGFFILTLRGQKSLLKGSYSTHIAMTMTQKKQAYAALPPYGNDGKNI